MSIKDTVLSEANVETIAELIGAVTAKIICNIIHACWFIFATNVIFHTQFNYGFKEILSFYLLVVTLDRLAPKKK
jgi:hypothetical protein